MICLCSLFNSASYAASQIPLWAKDAEIESRTVAPLPLAAYLLSSKYTGGDIGKREIWYNMAKRIVVRQKKA